jgi:DNA-binding NarL/FixJ family response regulator
VQTVLVCVRTTQAAATIGSGAQRLGVATAVRTATTAADAITQLATFPAAIVFADTALTRPDTVGFTRKVLAAVPHAQLVLFGPEEPAVAKAAIRAGARGLIGGTDTDVVSAAAKALLLVSQPSPRPDAPPSQVPGGEVVAAGSRTTSARGLAAGPLASMPATLGAYARPAGASLPAIVPSQRVDLPVEDGALVRAGVAVPSLRRPAVALTERELQVLRGMADGHSNAEIGRELFVSEDTVKTHARRLFRKLGARDRAHAVAAGFRAGLVR